MKSLRIKITFSLLSLVLALMPGLTACAGLPRNDLAVDISYSGKEVSLAQFGVLTLTLDTDQDSGISWIEKDNTRDNNILEFQDHKFVPSQTPTPGATGNDVWTFEAPKSGKTQLSFEYRAPYEGAMVYKKFELTVMVAERE